MASRAKYRCGYNRMRALSIRQPWAWLIVNGHKDIENRSWPTKVRGTIAIHASKGMTHKEYVDCYYLAARQGIKLPSLPDLQRGGIVGTADIVDCVSESDSPWYFGEYGFTLTNAKPLPFVPLLGKLGFFEVPEELA